MTTNDPRDVPPERAPETTSVFRADFLADVEQPAAEPAVSGVDGLPAGSALLVVRRGPNAGSRFPLCHIDQRWFFMRQTICPTGRPGFQFPLRAIYPRFWSSARHFNR